LDVEIWFIFKGSSAKLKINTALPFIKYMPFFNGIIVHLMIKLMKGIYKKESFKKSNYGVWPAIAYKVLAICKNK